MPHYLDQSRLALKSIDWPDDCVVEITEKWHFNDVVYSEQIHGQLLLEMNLGDLQMARAYNELLSDSKFSLCPVGAGPNTLRFWESVGAGTVPVIFDLDLEVFYKAPKFAELLRNVVVWESEINEELVKHLRRYSDDELQQKADNLQTLYQDLRTPIVLN